MLFRLEKGQLQHWLNIQSAFQMDAQKSCSNDMTYVDY